MGGLIRDFRSIAQLWRDRRNNPLLWYHSPARRNFPGIVFRLGELFALLTVVFVPLLMILTPELYIRLDPRTSVAVIVGTATAIVPLLFLLVAPGPWDRDRNDELLLSRMTPAEIAFGFLFWPILYTIILGVGLGFMTAFFCRQADARRWWGVNLLQTYWYLSALLAFATPPALGALTLGRWYANTAWRWVAILTVPLKAVPVAYVFVILIDLSDRRWSEEFPFWQPLIIAIIALGCAILRLRAGLAGAGARILDRSFPEGLLRSVWRLRDKALRRLPANGQSGVLRLVRHSLPALFIQFLACLFLIKGLGITYTVSAANLAARGGSLKAASTEGLMLEFLVLPACVAVGAMLASLPTRGRIPMLSGGVLPTVILYSLPPIVVYFLSMVAFILQQLGAPALEDLLGLAIIILVAAIIVAVASTALAIPNRGRALVTLLMVAITVPSGASLGFFSGSVSVGRSGACATLIVLLFSLCLLEALLLRLHRSELIDVPLGRFNTDDNTGLPLFPESIIDDLRAGK